MGKQLQQEGLTVVSLDESLFFYDTLVKRVWIGDKKPVLKITGSHKYSCLFGAISLDEKQIFRQYDKFDVYFFRLFKFPRYFFLDKASPHCKSRKAEYFEQNKAILIPSYLPTAFPEFMILEEVWNIAKQELLVLKYYLSFVDFQEKISKYFRTKRFGLDMRNYLLRMFENMLNGIINDNEIKLFLLLMQDA